MKFWRDKSGKWIEGKEFLTRFKDGIEKITPLQQLQTQMFGMLLIFAGILFGLVVAFRSSLWWLFIVLCGSMIVFISQVIGILQRYIILKAVEKMIKESEQDNSQEKKEDKTLSNLSSGDTKQGGINSQDDTKLQFERRASLPADNHPDNIQKEILK